MTANLTPITRLPDWVPSAVRVYLSHTENGRSLREIARDEGVHASTILRQVRRFENRRDDPLVDCALGRLKTGETGADTGAGGVIDESVLTQEARRILPRLAEEGVVLVVAPDMDRAVVLRGSSVRLAVLDRPVAEAFALRDWIRCDKPGRVACYEISAAGRAELRRLRGDIESENRGASDRDLADTRRTRPVTSESPVSMLARRRDRDGQPFLTPDLVSAAERLREDFEIAQMGYTVTQSWDRLLSGPIDGGRRGGVPGEGPRAARDRLIAALDELGPGLADLALLCCCHLEGLETAERKLGWSARSGKIVLRIALMRLRRHYDALGDAGCMLG